MNQQKISKKNDKSKYSLVFKLITILIPFLILIIFEGVLRLANYGDDLHLFIKNPDKGYEKFMMVNPKIGEKYFQKLEYSLPPNDIFYAKKPANSFRIFVMGSSTVVGFPYERNLMFSRILNQQLADAYPDKKIEVINTAITAINSFTLLDYTNEILKYQPDAVLIYAGHNEFYGAFGIGSNETMSRNRELTRLHIFLMKFRLYQMIRNLISDVAGKFSANGNAVHGTLMKRIVAKADILMNSDEYRVAMKRYRENMEDILKKFHKKNIPVFLSELVSNVKDIKPFNSIASDTLPAAIDIFNEAKAAANKGDFDKASQLFYRAKDLDCVRFRASEDVNYIVDDLAEKYRAFKVPMLEWFKKNSEHQLIGNNVMTEHVHPNIKGIFLMAQAFYNKVVESEVIGKENSPGYSMEYYKRNWGYTALDSLLAHHRIKQLKGYWPFVKDISNESDYREYYRPVSYIDSLAFEVMKNPELNLATVRLSLARKYEKQKQIEKAYKEYDALLCTNPYLAISYRDAANCLIQLGDLPLALKYYQKSLEYDDQSYVAYFRIGEIYLIKGDYDTAVINFKKSFDFAPDDKKVNVLGRTYIAYVYSGKTAEAKAVAAELKRVNATRFLNIPSKNYEYNRYIPFQTKEQVLKARQLFKEQKYQEALDLLKASLNIYDSHVAKRLIGDIYLEERDFDNALIYYKKVIDEFKFDPVFWHRMALIYIEKKDLTNARNCIQDIKNIDPNYEGLKLLNLLAPGSN